MDEECCQKRLAKLREVNPAMFGHPDSKPGEVWIGDVLPQAVDFTTKMYSHRGVSTVRIGSQVRKKAMSGYIGGVEHHALFMAARQFILFQEGYLQLH